MIISTWNIRGLNAPSKQQEIRAFLLNQKVDLMGILETRVRAHNASKVQRGIFSHTWKLVANYQCHENGRIWLAWRSSRVHLEVIEVYDQLLWCLVKNNGVSFYLAVVYGLNTREGRLRLWGLLNSLIGFSSDPCLLMGDFNVTLCDDERISSYDVDRANVEDFRRCCATTSLVDLPYTGLTFTWCNKQDGLDRTWCKLDRVMGNAAWFQFFGVIANLLAPGISDHSPALVNLESVVGRKRGGFKFLNGWMEDPQVHAIIRDAWEGDFRGTKMFQLVSKLKSVKRSLQCYHRGHFTNISQRVSLAREELLQVQYDLNLQPRDVVLIEQEKRLMQELLKIQGIERRFYQQRAKIQYLQQHDENTKFFQAKMRENTLRNKVHCISTMEGSKLRLMMTLDRLL
ncbi:hypothetical protein RND81_11G077000 [Saponaria officinalis]|uniref:Endonuclease/exonuclease/phosphatase domain-containing protein n=1 Tax=Saponaria officinalis TaxID=3572 RepID=A0AAW1HJ73_SAPOF